MSTWYGCPNHSCKRVTVNQHMVVSFYSFKFQANTTSIINYSVISSQYSHNLLDASIDSHSVFVGPEIKIQFQHLQPVALQGGNHCVAYSSIGAKTQWAAFDCLWRECDKKSGWQINQEKKNIKKNGSSRSRSLIKTTITLFRVPFY